MGIRFSIRAGTARPQTGAANVVLRAGICTEGVANDIFELDPGQDPTTAAGYGPLPVAAASASRLGGAKQILIKVPASIAGSIGAVTESPSGTGPTITIAGSSFDSVTNSPFDAYKLRAKVLTGGPVGTAVLGLNLDGGLAYPYTFDVPAEAHATLIGTVDLTGITLSTLNATTLKIDEDTLTQQTVTFTTPSSVADIATQINAGTSNITADIIQGKYLRVVSDTAGTASTLAIDASSTGEAILGFSSGAGNLTATGAASTISIVGTGLVITCPATSDYVPDTIYSSNTTRPRHSQAALDAALAVANADLTLAWGIVEIVQEPVDAPDLRSYADDLDALFADMEAQEDKRFGVWIIGANPDASDASVKLAMAGHVSRHGAVTAGDIYTTETTPLPKGSMRRSACRPLGIRLASESLSEDPGIEPSLPLCSMTAPDGSTLARNDNTATQKLGGSAGPGFTVIKAKKGLPYFKRGVTRAGQNSVFVDIGVARMTAFASTIIFDRLRTQENRTYDLNPDGTLQEADASALEESFEDELRRLLVQAKHASDVRVTIDRTEKVSDTRNLTVNYSVQIRGQQEDITGTLSLSGELTIEGQAAA